MLRALTFVVSAAALGGCGGGVSKPDMKATKGSAADATGRVAVAVTDGPTTPLIVDWQPEQRTDLEAAIREGVVVVRLDKKGLKILAGCKLQHGDYGYVGVVTKKEVIQLKTAQQVAANLPLTGGVLGAQIGGELSRGATLELSFVPTDRATLQTTVEPNIFALGDATDLPTSKAGSVTHFEAEVLTENVGRYFAGEELERGFDGHANCFVETGFHKALLIDFNYETEPLPGHFPTAIGLPLLRESRLNHLGKLAFQWVYWHALLPGRALPGIGPAMPTRGKKTAVDA